MILEPWYEWRLGIRAFGPGKGKSFSIPTDHHTFREIMRHVDIRPNEDVFIDYGCGRGRVLALASTYPFRRVIGIEYSEELSALAQRNVQHINRRYMNCVDIEVITGDAGTYELPADVTIVYFFNPFGEDVFRRVVEQIHRSVLETPRPVTIIYYAPECEALLDACEWLTKVHDFGFLRRRCCIYKARS